MYAIRSYYVGRFPIVLVGTDFWKGLVDWIQDVVQQEERNIGPDDLGLFTLVDTAEEAVA